MYTNLSTSINVSDVSPQISSTVTAAENSGKSVFSEILQSKIDTTPDIDNISLGTEVKNAVSDIISKMLSENPEQANGILQALAEFLTAKAKADGGDTDMAALQYIADTIAALLSGMNAESIRDTNVQTLLEPTEATTEVTVTNSTDEFGAFSTGAFGFAGFDVSDGTHGDNNAAQETEQSETEIAQAFGTETADAIAAKALQRTNAEIGTTGITNVADTAKTQNVVSLTQNERIVTDEKTLALANKLMGEFNPILRKAIGAEPLKLPENDGKPLDMELMPLLTTKTVIGLKANVTQQTDVSEELAMLVGNNTQSAENETLKLFVPKSVKNADETQQALMSQNSDKAGTNGLFALGQTITASAQTDETTTPVVIRTPALQISDEISAKLTSMENGETSFEMTLNPEGLGKIFVKLTTVGERIAVQIIAEKPETELLLHNRSAELQTSLKANGVELESYQTVYQAQSPYKEQNFGENFSREHNNRQPQQEYANNNEDDDTEDFAELLASM